MLDELKELWRFRELLLTMVQRDLKIRYKNSIFGFLLSVINPLVSVGVMTFVMRNFVAKAGPSYGAYVFAGYIPFIFFQFCLLDAAQTILVAMPLIKKIYFPREILPLAAVIANFIHFVLMFGLFLLVLLGVYCVHPGEFPIQTTVVFVPLLMLIMLMLATGCSLIVAALNTFYEDVKYIVSLGLYLMYFLCPIIYFSEQVTNSQINHDSGGWVHKIYHLNPMAMMCTSFKQLCLAPGKTEGPHWFDVRYLIITAVTSLVILILGYGLFNRLKWRFVERP